jgi:hypothetical protein
MYPLPYARSLSTEEEEEFLDRKARRFFFFELWDFALEVKKERMPKPRGFREIFRREDEVEDVFEVLESARDRSETLEG